MKRTVVFEHDDDYDDFEWDLKVFMEIFEEHVSGSHGFKLKWSVLE